MNRFRPHWYFLACLIAMAGLSGIDLMTARATTADDLRRIGQAGAYIDKAIMDIDKLMVPKTIGDVSAKADSINLAVKFLKSHSTELGAGVNEPEVKTKLDEISQAASRLTVSAAGVAAIYGTPLGKSTAYVVLIKKRWAEIKAEVKPGIFGASLEAPIYACIMHPGQTRTTPGTCPLCGMVMIPKQAFQIALDAPVATIFADVQTQAPLQVGVEADCTLKLHTADGMPVTADDLAIMHTQPIHLLIIDHSLGDYHHEHPVPTEEPGEYRFHFTPQKPGPYRVFADVVAKETGRQEYARADIASEQKGEEIVSKETQLHAQIEGLSYTLTFDHETLKVGEPVMAKVHIERVSDQTPFTQLEPVMSVFAHFVGFHEDRVTVFHVHPLGPDPVPAKARGGPDLQFLFTPGKVGFVRFYLQVQIGGANKFAPFSLNFVAQ